MVTVKLHPSPAFGPEQFEELNALYSGPDAPEGCLGLDGIEGFFCAIASGTGGLHVDRWISLFERPSGSEGKLPERTLPEANRQLSLLLAFYNHVAAGMMQSDAPQRLIFPCGTRNDFVAQWCAGYLLAIELEDASWRPLIQAQPRWFEPIFRLAMQVTDNPPVEENLDALREQLPDSLRKIHRHFLAQRTGVRVREG